MNLSNEKNTLLNTVSRLAVDAGARGTAKFVTRGAMTAVALTVATFALVDSSPAIATCSTATGTGDGVGNPIICSSGAGGFDADGYDAFDIRVLEDGVASAGVGIDLGSGTDGTSNNNTVFVFDLFFGGTTVGTVTGTAGDGIVIEGDGNTVNNGFTKASDIVGGGKISGTADGIDIDGINNTVNNFDNGNGANSGVISGGGDDDGDHGIEVSGGTSGNVNTINNGLQGKETAYIISGGTPGAATVDGGDGINASGWTNVNNGTLGEIHGEDRGIEFTGTGGATLTVDNDGKIIGDIEDGILIVGDKSIVNYSGDGTVKGGATAAGIDISPTSDDVKLTVTFGPGTTGLITGGANGIELGDTGIASNNTIINISGKGIVEGNGATNADGIHVFEPSSGTDITIDGGATIRGKDDGIDLGTGSKLLVQGASIVKGDTDSSGGGDGIQGNDNNNIQVTGGSKVYGDPGILVDDNNIILIDGGAEVNSDPNDGINVDDDNTITIGGAGGAGYVKTTGGGDGISLTDGFDGPGSTNDNTVTIGDQGQVLVTGSGNGIVVGTVGDDNDNNSVTVEDGGLVDVENGDGIVVNGQDGGADNNTVDIDDGGVVDAGGDGVRLLGDDQVTTGLDAANGGDFLGDPDGTGNDLDNDGIIRAGDDGVLVSNTNSDVRNQGGEIYAGGDGVRFTTIHTDEVDGDLPAGFGEFESGYQSDNDSLIVAGRDGIHYDNYNDDGFGSDFNAGLGQDVNGLGEIDDPLDLLFGIKGYFPEVVDNQGTIEAGRHGIRVNDDFAVTNGEDAVIVAGGLPGEGPTGGDGIHADANNFIRNQGIIASGEDANGDSHGIQVIGESNTIVNDGIIDTRGDTFIDDIDNTTLESGDDENQDNGAGGDGIHASVDGLSLLGLVKNGYDQQEIYNGNTIIAADDGIDAKSGLGIPGGEQLIDNDSEATITANDDGIVAEHYNIIDNEGTINADDDNEGGGDGINVGHSNVVTNSGDINSIGGNGIVMDGQKGPFSFGNLVTNEADGNIVAGEDGIQVNGEQNYIENYGDIKGGTNGVALNDEENDFLSFSGLIEGGTGAGIYSDEDNDIELSGTTKVTTTLSKGGDGIFLEDDNSLEIEDGVTVWGDNDGIVLDGDDNDVDYEGGAGIDPELKGRTGDALEINGDSNTFDSTDDLDLQGGDDGIHIGGNTNSVDIDGDVSGEDDGIYLETATGNVVNVDGDVTGDIDDAFGGDGVDIFGGGSNTVTVGGAISGDPGVVITNSNNNDVSGASISGTDGGVVISNGNNNTVASTVGDIDGDSDDDGDGNGVDITGTSNVVTSAGAIYGEDAVVIDGNANQVSSTTAMAGTDDGVVISGTGNIVDSGAFISGEDGDGVVITGSSNSVSAASSISGEDTGVAITGNNNEVTSTSINGGFDDGVRIDGDSNLIDTGEIFGGDSGVDIDGDSNNVDATKVSGDGDAIYIAGDNNAIQVDGDIIGDVEQAGYGHGVLIDGNNNTVSGEDIGVSGTGSGGVVINGNSNTIDAATISGEDGPGVGLNGNNNSVTTDGAILSTANDGVNIFGLGNDVLSGGPITGEDDGVEIEGINNSVVAFGDITGRDGNGVDVSGNNNSVAAAGEDADISGGTAGVVIDGSNNTVTGEDITGFAGDGVNVEGDNNTIEADGNVSGTDDGVYIDGDSNDIDIDGTTTGTSGDGIGILGDNNTVDSGTVTGGDDGVAIVGVNNIVRVDGDINGDSFPGAGDGTGDGVDIKGAFNNVSATGSINGDPGVIILGNQNNVGGADINGLLGGASITGNQNTVTSLDDIATVSGAGVGITGNQNNVFAVDDISSVNDDGININGNQNNVTSKDVIAGKDGIQINGNQNFVDIAATINAGQNGVWFDSGTGNDVDLTNVKIDAGADGILVDVDGNTFQHNANTVINAGDDGIEYEYGGLVNAYESLVWLGTINAKDDGIVADQGFFTIINNGTINADTDKNSDGNGITVTSDNNVENNGTITGWNGIVGDDRNDILNDGIITVTNDGIVVDDDNKVVNNGTITAGDDGIVAGDKNYIENNSPVTIIAKDNGIEAGSLNTIVNTGTLTADSDDNNDGDGINAVDSNTITNTSTGNIKGWNGIVVNDSNEVTNNGNITGENNGIDGDDLNKITNTDDIDAGNIGIDVDDGNTITNSGEIDAGNIGINADFGNTITNSNWILGQQDGIVAVGSNTITNSGSVKGTTDDGVQLGSGNILTNTSTGTINGGDDGVEINGSTNGVTNSNTITGTNDGVSVLSGSGNVVTNNDLIQGGDDGVDFDTGGNSLYNYSQVLGGNNGVEANGNSNYIYSSNLIDGGDDGIDIEGDSNVVDIDGGTVVGGDDGIEVDGNSNDIDNVNGSIIGESDDGIEIDGNSNSVFSTGSITGEDEGIELDGSNNDIQNGTSLDDNASIWGQEGDGIDINSGGNNEILSYGSITGFWDGIDNTNGDLFVDNIGGTITGQNSDGISSNLGSGSSVWTNIENLSEGFGEDLDEGRIIGKDDGIDVGGEDLFVGNYTNSLIQGQNDDGIHTTANRSVVYNDGKIIGKHTGITDGSDFNGEDGSQSTYIVNDTNGLITGGEAGYLYEDGPINGGEDSVQIDNFGEISATDLGTLPTPLVDDPATKDVDESKGALDYINGKGADPVAAIDTREGEVGLEVFIFNWGEINGANTFSAEIPAVPDDPATKDVNEAKDAVPPQQLSNRFAILGGEGNEYVANFAGGTINGHIWTQAGDDVLALEIGSTLNGDVNLGQTLETAGVLGLIKDDPTTKDVDESAGGTAVGFVSTPNVDTGLDAVILFGEGYQDLASNITEAEVMYVNDRLTQDDIYSVGPEDGIEMSAAIGNPVLENQPFPVGTWSLNGNVKIDGTNLWTLVDVDGNGNGVLDEEAATGDDTIAMISGTVGTIVDNGRLNIGGTVITEIPGEPTDEEEGELEPSTFDVNTNSKAVLTSPVVDVLSGGILGGHGTIVTNPGANGGNGGVNLSGAVQGDKTFLVGADEDNIVSQTLFSEARGSLIIGTAPGDLITQGEDGKITDATKGDGTDDFKFVPAEDEEDPPVKVDLLYTVDDAGKLYPTITLPAGWVAEEFAGPFDFTTDSPRYATLAPGDEITRIGTLTVVGNVKMDGRATGVTNYKIAVADDPATKDVDESKDAKGNQVFKNQAGREVVTNWGSQFQADLKDDGKGDLLLVKKSGVTTAFTGSTFDTKGPGPVDLVTQGADGKVTDGTKGDGVNDFTIVVDGETKTKVDTIVAGKGGADGVPDGVSYKVSTVLDGNATVDGRLDIRLDGEFVDLVDNSQSPTIVDPDKTGCGDDPDGADSCFIPNPLYAIPDGIADVDAKGIAKNNADFSKDAKVWDIIVAEGGVTGKFDEKGFDGGPNDGAVVVRYAVADDPTTEEDETVTEVRQQLLKAYLQYLPDRVRIISIPNFEPKGTTLNQTLTGEYLDTLTKYGLNEDPLHAAIALVGTATDIPAALDALHPEWYNAFNEVGFSIARGAEQQAYIRTIEAQGFSGGQQNRVVMNVGDDSAVGSSASDRRATFWLAGSWGNANIDDGSDEGWLEYKYETLTGYAGFDYLINPNFLIGILGGFGNSDVDAKNGTKEGDVDSWQVGGYISYFTQSWFVNAGGGIGDMNIESIRNIQFGSGIGNVSQIATADYDGDITYFYGKGGYSFDMGNSGWKLSPELALSYAKVKQDGFSETGTGNAAVFLLDVDGQSVKSVRGTAQLRLSKTFLAGNGGGWMPYVRVGIANEFEDDLRPITSGFQGAPGTSFTVFGQVPRETTVIFGAGVSGKVSEMFSLYLDYSGEIGGSFSEHVISGGVRLHF